MRGILPRFELCGATISDGDGPDADGYAVYLWWLGFVVSISVARAC